MPSYSKISTQVMQDPVSHVSVARRKSVPMVLIWNFNFRKELDDESPRGQEGDGERGCWGYGHHSLGRNCLAAEHPRSRHSLQSVRTELPCFEQRHCAAVREQDKADQERCHQTPEHRVWTELAFCQVRNRRVSGINVHLRTIRDVHIIEVTLEFNCVPIPIRVEIITTWINPLKMCPPLRIELSTSNLTGILTIKST